MNTKEAIEIVKTHFDKWALTDEDLTALQVLGLVDAESENEKIRNRIIGYLKLDIEEYPERKERIEEMLAYLEKQKALSELSKYIAAERTKPGFMFSGNSSVSWEELPLQVRKHDYPYYFIGDLDCYPFVVEEKKPAEWSKEDDALLKEIVSFFKDGTVKLQHDLDLYAGFLENKFKSLRPQSKREWNEEDEEKYVPSKEMILAIWELGNEWKETNPTGITQREYIQKHWKESSYYDKIKSIRHQLKIDWSEEDKRKLNRIYEILGYAADDKGFLTSKRIIGDKEATELQDFLKSLRPQSKQEWSEEDKRMLDSITNVLGVMSSANFIPIKREIMIPWLESLPKRFNLQSQQEWSEDIIRKAIKEVGLTQHQINWFKNNVFPPKQEWSEEDEKMFKDAIRAIHLAYPYALDDETLRKKNVNWLKDLKERFNSLPKQEWSEEDEQILNAAIDMVEKGNVFFTFENNKWKVSDWLKLLPKRFGLQPKQEWNEEDEETREEVIRDLCVLIDWIIKYDANWLVNPVLKNINKRISWLKSLKNRGNSQKINTNSQSWSEEDRDRVAQYLHDMDGGMLWSKATEITSDILDILRPQPHCKPNENEDSKNSK